MANDEVSFDPDDVLAGLLSSVRATTISQGHSLGPWRFEDDTNGYRILAICSACQAVARIVMGASETNISVHPVPHLDRMSTAVRYRCLRGV